MFNIPESYTMAMTHEIAIRLPELPASWLAAIALIGALYVAGRFAGRPR